MTSLARRQHRVVGRSQLKTLGISDQTIRSWLAGGRLFRIHQGVYSLGPPPLTRLGEWMAAALACGPSSLISHKSAAALWGLARAGGGPTHVTIEGPAHPRRPGINLHRTRSLHPADRTSRNAIPVTSVARTLVDQAGALGKSALRRQVEEADRLGLLRLNELLAACDRAGGRRGIGNLREILRGYTGAPDTRPGLEDLLLDLCRDYGIQPPRCNAKVAGWEVDAVWEEARLAVELDGYAFHHDRAQFHRDREKGLALAAAGYEPLRLSSPQLKEGRETTAAYLRRRIGKPRAG